MTSLIFIKRIQIRITLVLILESTYHYVKRSCHIVSLLKQDVTELLTLLSMTLMQ